MPPSEEHLFRARREASIYIGTDVVAKYKSSRLYSQGNIARMCGPKIEGEAYDISFDDGYFPAHSTLTTPIRSIIYTPHQEYLMRSPFEVSRP